MFVVQTVKLPTICFPRLSLFEILSIIVFLIASCFHPQNTFAAKVTLAWDESYDENLAAYSLYCRLEGRTFDYNDPLWTGTDTICTIHNLNEDTVYYFVIRALDIFGKESGNSGEVFYQPPPTSGELTVAPETSHKSGLVAIPVPVSNASPWQPTIFSHYDGQIERELQPLITTEPFLDPDSDSQSWSQWQISKIDDFAVPVLNALSTKHLTELIVPNSVLEPNTTYFVRVRFYDTYLVPSVWSEPIEFTIISDEIDSNDDGVPDEKEVELGLDMNSNGVDDLEEPDRIKCVRSVYSNVIIGISAASDSVAGIEVVDAIDPEAVMDDENQPSLPFGLFCYRIRVESPGAIARVRIYFSEDISKATTLYKHDTVNGWQDYSQYTTFNDDGRSITLEVKDGGYGDSDGVANGIIVDPGGLSDEIGSSVDALGPNLGGSQGGCFINTGTNSLEW
jgi:hypothetical protein